MNIVEFIPTEDQRNLVLNTLIPENGTLTLEHTLFIQYIEDNREVIPELVKKNYKYIVTFSNQQAYFVLRNSPYSLEIAHKTAFPYDMGIFKLTLSKNPEESDEDILSAITSAKIQPKESWYESFVSRYNNWKMAWWREVLQNAVDTCRQAYRIYGRYGKIRCEIHTYENSDRVLVTVGDNGMGMDVNTFTKAFLTPGESSKRETSTSGESTTGGLGKAKEMLYFAWPQWAIITKMDDAKKAIFVKARYAPFMGDNILEKSLKPREHPGTKITVTMKTDRCVSQADLAHFIEMSSFENIAVYFRSVQHQADGSEYYLQADGTKIKTDEVTDEWIKLDAKNTVPKSMDPVKILTRSDGSPWAKVYHLPKARNFREVVIRSNGLYLFTAPGEFDIPGKVIIELIYKPKGKKWDKEAEEWVDMSVAEMAKQSIENYGPLELLTEGRDNLLDTYPNRWATQLNTYLDNLKREPKATLKRVRPKNRIRAVNKQKPKLELDQLLEQFKPTELLTNPEEALDKLQKIEDNVIIEALIEGLKDGTIDVIHESDKALDKFSEGQKIRLKDLINHPEIIDLIQNKMIEKGIEGSGEPTNMPALIETIKNVDISAVDTSADPELWKELIKPLIKEANESGKGPEFTENMTAMLRWEPDFIMSDETELPTPKPPSKFNPTQFGPKERRTAKFWVEAIRLIHIIEQIKNPSLDVGFLFENPDSDEYLGEFLVSDGGAGDNEYTQDIGAFKAVLIAPAMVSDNDKNWKHRYNFSSRKDITKIVSVAFHEVIHANRHAGGDTYGWTLHDTQMSSLLTNDIATAMQYALLFYKLADYCEKLYPIKGATEGKVVKTKLEAGKGYYQVECPGVRGAKPVFATLQEARNYVDQNYPTQRCTIAAFYWPDNSINRKDNAWRVKTLDYYAGKEAPEYYRDSNEPISNILEEIQSDWDSTYARPGSFSAINRNAKGNGKDVWRNPQKKRLKKRRK